MISRVMDRWGDLICSSCISVVFLLLCGLIVGSFFYAFADSYLAVGRFHGTCDSSPFVLPSYDRGFLMEAVVDDTVRLSFKVEGGKRLKRASHRVDFDTGMALASSILYSVDKVSKNVVFRLYPHKESDEYFPRGGFCVEST
jgi:hypothetical protein